MADDPFLVINRRMLDDLLDGTPKRLRVQMRNLWIHLLLEAGFNGTDRGKLKTGRRELAGATGLSEKTIRTLLNHLKSGQQVASKGANKGQYLTIVNYDAWTLSSEKSGHQNGQQVASPCTKAIKHVKQEPKSMHVVEAVKRIAKHYRDRIAKKAKLTPGAAKKIKTRLGEFSEEELLAAIDRFVDKDPWWMANNGKRGMLWFFHSEDRIDQFLNLEQRAAADQAIDKCPHCSTAGFRSKTKSYPKGNPRVPPQYQGVPIHECGRCQYREKAGNERATPG